MVFRRDRVLIADSGLRKGFSAATIIITHLPLQHFGRGVQLNL
jgi:hypothetical protein